MRKLARHVPALIIIALIALLVAGAWGIIATLEGVYDHRPVA